MSGQLTVGIVFPPPLSVGLVIGLELVVAGVVLFLAGAAILRRWPGAAFGLAIGRTLALVAGGVLVVAAVLGEQTPGSDIVNPIPGTTQSITAGAAIYQANCAACHGAEARGGGPAAGTTQVPPTDLRSGHLNIHTDGDIYYWISNGQPGGMPAWASRLSENDRWNLVNYLRSINGRALGTEPPSVSPASDAAGPLLAVVPLLVPLGWVGLLVGAARRSSTQRSRRR
jgi:mono/diheme cytochrome c family protein